MALIYYSQEIFREIVKQTERSHARLASVKITRVILNAGAISDLLDHLDVISHPFIQTLGFKLSGLTAEKFHLLAEIELYLSDSRCLTRRRGDENVGRINSEFLMIRDMHGVFGIKSLKRFDLIAPENYPEHDILIGEAYVDGVTLDSEIAALKIDLITGIKRCDKFTQKSVTCDFLSNFHFHDILVKILGITYAVKA